MKKEIIPTGGSFLLYTTPDGRVKIETRMQGETVWLTINQMAELFQVDKSGISRHLKNIFESRELLYDSVVAIFATTASDKKTYQVDHYNLDAIISVGYRVNSLRGTQFRIWATDRLKEYIVKGFTLDDERLKHAGGGNYFDELLARIRDIRSSEKVFWRKVLEIYATSIDYSPKEEISQQFFRIIQNKMHWAAHGHTAAEVVYDRADAAMPNMGLTSWKGHAPRKEDVVVAKNYLKMDELEILNRIVTAYLEFAELQATNHIPMYMKDWIVKLDDFLKLSGKELLLNAGTVSHEQAAEKALLEYQKYRECQINEPDPVEHHFFEAIKEIKQIETKRRVKK